MSVTVYRSTDAGAPVLNGTSGNGLVNLFDICLVGSGTAYGALPKKGWTKPYSGTNKGVYLTVDGGCYLRVMHDGSNTGGFREALVRAAEGATGVDTLVDQFPSTSDVAAGNETWRISDTLDTTARAWVLIASENWLTLHVMFGASANVNDQYIFGKYSPIEAANDWSYVISVRNASNTNTQAVALNLFVSVFSQTITRLFAMRTPDGSVKAPRASFVTPSSNSAAGALSGVVGPVIPDAAGRIKMSPPQIWINSQAGGTALNPSAAGYFPNLWCPLHNCGAAGAGAAFGDRFNSSIYDPSAQFELMGGALSNAGKLIFELTDTWQDPTL